MAKLGLLEYVQKVLLDDGEKMWDAVKGPDRVLRAEKKYLPTPLPRVKLEMFDESGFVGEDARVDFWDPADDTKRVRKHPERF